MSNPLRCPWYVSAAAVRDWQRLDRNAPRDFDDASDALLQLCAEVWARYRESGKEPELKRTGGWLYHTGRAHNRIRLVVSEERRPEGNKAQVVAILARSER